MPTPRSPYLRIAAELRQRISTLAPGDRLPSTRRLAEESGVALATASKVLQLLAREGLVEAIPRVGNVVARPSPASTLASAAAAPAEELNVARIVAAALAIADREGLDAVSLRGLSAKMNVPVMSLYRHVSNKEDLVRRMVDAAMGEWHHPARLPPEQWRAQVEIGARLEWQLLRRHPWIARVVTLTRPEPTRNAILHADWMLAGFEAAGADARTRMNMHVLIFAFLQGLATNLEAEVRAVDDTGVDEAQFMESRMPGFTSLAASGAFPAFARTMAALDARDGSDDYDPDLDETFELGLALLLDGFAKKLRALDH